MKLDHIALRLTPENHKKALEMYVALFEYSIIDTFAPTFSDDPNDTQECTCTVLCPPIDSTKKPNGPQLFISSSTDPNSIVAKWVEKRKQTGSFVHHMAYVVSNIKESMEKFKKFGYEFLGDKIISCENGLQQTFTRPVDLTGVIYELMEKPILENGEMEDVNFCKSSVGNLMKATEEVK